MKKRKPSAAVVAAEQIARTRRFIWIWVGCSVIAATIAGVASWWEYTHPIPVERYVKVYRQHGCTCAIAWGRALEAEGFVVSLYEPHDLQEIRRYLRTPADFHGCHVAQIGQYFIEGHVPGNILRRLMHEHPQGLGIAVVAHPRKDGDTEQVLSDIVLLDREGEKHPINRDPNADTLQL